MKARKFFSVTPLVVLMVAVLTPASAKGKLTVYPYPNSDYALISALNEEAVYFAVEIKTPNGELIYSSGKVDDSMQFNKLFDFSELEDGEYYAIMRNKNGAFLKEKFAVANGKILVDELNKKMEKLVANVWTKSDYLYVSYLNSSFDTYKIKVADERGSVLFESVLPKDLTYSGKFDVSSLPSGTYYVSLISGENENRYAIKK